MDSLIATAHAFADWNASRTIVADGTRPSRYISGRQLHDGLLSFHEIQTGFTDAPEAQRRTGNSVVEESRKEQFFEIFLCASASLREIFLIMTHNEISAIIVDAAVNIHRRLGPGLLESVCKTVLEHELTKRGLRVQREVSIPVDWDGLRMDVGFRADLIIEGMVLVELKSVETIAPVHKKQMITHLRLTKLRLGLLLNFGAALMKDGVHRVANGLEE